jgi:hypothetical protein
MHLKKITIATKDIQTLTGRSYWYALKIMNQIRKKNKKEKHHLITIHEVCEHLSLPLEDCINLLKLR